MKVTAILFALLTSMTFFVASPAFAARAYSMSVIYFDANSNIIGQQAAFCNNVTTHGGNIDPSNPYHVVIQGGCGDKIIHCEPGDLGYTCTDLGNNNAVKVTYFRSATGMTLDQACNTIISCDLVDPDLAYGWGFDFSPGYQ